MNPYDEAIRKLLKGKISLGFQQVLDEVNISNNTLRLHPDSRVNIGMIVREKVVSDASGRSRYLYSISKRPGRGAEGPHTGDSVIVVLPFATLRCLCRDQRGGRWRETKDACEAENCAQIKKEE